MWEGVRYRTELQHIDPYSYGHQRFFPVLLGCSTGGLGAQLSGCCFFSTASFLQLVWFLNSLNFLCTELYNSSTPAQYLPITGHRNMNFHRPWNSMFDRHRAEINVMRFTGHSLSVHQFVTVPWDFNPVPYYQPSSPTPMEYAISSSLGWHVWPGRRSIYYIMMSICTIYYMMSICQYTTSWCLYVTVTKHERYNVAKFFLEQYN